MTAPRVAKLSALALSGLTVVGPAQAQQQSILTFARTLAFEQPARKDNPAPPDFPTQETAARIAKAVEWSAYQRRQGNDDSLMISEPPPNFGYNRFLGMWDLLPLADGTSYKYDYDKQAWQEERIPVTHPLLPTPTLGFESLR